MANWVIRSADSYLSLLYDRLHELIYENHIIHADETPVKVMSIDGVKIKNGNKNLTFASDSTVGKYAGNIIAFPTTVLVDKGGNIISEPFMGGIDDQANYEQLMKQIQSILDQK